MKNRIISIIGMIALLALSLGFDRWFQQFERSIQGDFDASLLRWWIWVSSIPVFAVIVMALAWWVFRKSNSDRVISYVFLGTGLLVWIISTPAFNRIWAYLPFDRFPRTWVRHINIIPDQLVVSAGAFIAAIGIWSLIGKRQVTV